MRPLIPDQTILGILAVEPQHGYQLLECFRDPTQLGLVWDLSTSQLYAVLKRLEQSGAVVGYQLVSENAPPRTEYRMSPTGLEQFDAWLDDPAPSPSIRRVRVEFLSRLYVARLLNRPTNDIVLRQKQSCQAELARLQEQRAMTPSGVGLLTVELVIAQLEAVLQWIDRCELVPYPPPF